MDLSNLKLLAQYCAAAYIKKADNVKFAAAKISSDWRFASISDDIHGANDLFYRSYAMVNNRQNKIIVINSGTRINQIKQIEKKGLLSGIVSNIEVFFKSVPRQFTEDGIPYLNNLITKFPNYEFICTGHSLGAVFAQLSHAYLKSHDIKATSYVFESPGSFDLINNYINENYFKLTIDDLAKETQVFNTEPNIINLLHKQLGNTYRIQEKVDEDCTISNALYKFFTQSLVGEDKELKKLLSIGEKLEIAFNTFESHGIDYIVENLDTIQLIDNAEDTVLFNFIAQFQSTNSEL